MTINHLVKLIGAAAPRSNERARLEEILVATAKNSGAVYYSDVGPTGAWNVYGDCYDYADAHPDQNVIETGDGK